MCYFKKLRFGYWNFWLEFAFAAEWNSQFLTYPAVPCTESTCTKVLLLNSVGPERLPEVLTREWDFCRLIPSKALVSTMVLLESESAILVAQNWEVPCWTLQPEAGRTHDLVKNSSASPSSHLGQSPHPLCFCCLKKLHCFIPLAGPMQHPPSLRPSADWYWLTASTPYSLGEAKHFVAGL